MDLAFIFFITASPLIAFLKIVSLPKRLKGFAIPVALTGILLSFFSVLVFALRHPEIRQTPFEVQWTWMVSSQFTFNVGFLIDRLNLLMLFIVILVSFFVQVFSISYMAEEGKGKSRYFAFLSFFSFSMINLVISNNLLQTFIFWELVGLASYLLIGFWYHKPSAADASRKAFVVTRLGDFGFYVAVALLAITSGNLNFSHLNSPEAIHALSPHFITWITLLIFGGVMGKSAQFPLHIWLPDAMEGPTPVSALIHSATMVAAGVFLTARNFALFSASLTSMNIVLIFGTLTALVGATLATIQNDIKKILAYSTISQLGLMMMALGGGSYEGGMFHLTTHAFFKSLLFLCAGSLIHHFHTNDIWEMAKKGSCSQTLTLLALTVGGLSLAGIFPFAGFWSKDLILEALHTKPLFYSAGMIVSFLTSYYIFRLLFILYFRSALPEEGHGHHEKKDFLSVCLNFPLVTLAIGSFIVGLMGTGLFHYWLLKFILPQAEGELSMKMALAGSAIAFLGLGAAYWNYLYKKAEPILESKGMRILLDKKYFMDDLFEKVLGRIVLAFSGFLNWFDKKMINGMMVNGTGLSTFRLGAILTKIQSGELQDYLMILFVVASAMIYFLVGR
ncbi:MAG: NADH-quinone oxidoreductase subunit L [Chlamydiae bacterium]|nr:NADH-quinone oxidoreductase subunit L [Chlamydiota bacterium]MBI3277825.1 NADH-quinone oxidoreductase subunit L [Chlamydiota bacterium]